jgi:hypothetical protein
MTQQESITIATTNTGNSAILSRGNLFVKDREIKKSKTWRCSTHGCPARLKTSLDFKDPIYSNEHNHELKAEKDIAVFEFRKQCKKCTAEDLFEKPAKLMRRAREVARG